MISTVPFKEKTNIIGIKISGMVDDVSFKRSTRPVLLALDELDQFNIYLEITSISGISWEVLWDSFKIAMNDLSTFLDKVEKIAVVTDLNWVQVATKIENAFIPHIQERVFSLKEKAIAVHWLNIPS